MSARVLNTLFFISFNRLNTDVVDSIEYGILISLLNFSISLLILFKLSSNPFSTIELLSLKCLASSSCLILTVLILSKCSNSLLILDISLSMSFKATLVHIFEIKFSFTNIIDSNILL